MSNSKRNKMISLTAIALCLAFASTFVLAFTACDEESASADSEVTPAEKTGFVSGGSYTLDEFGAIIYDEPPVTVTSEVIETVRVGNDVVTDVSEFDENGVATCTYGGQEMYLTLGGGVYDFYPYSYTLAPIAMTAETAEIQVSFIFKSEPRRKDGRFSDVPKYVEVSSLTGEPFDITDIFSHVLLDYLVVDEYGGFVVRDDYEGTADTSAWLIDSLVYTDTVEVYGALLNADEYDILQITLANGDSYTYGFDSISWIR